MTQNRRMMNCEKIAQSYTQYLQMHVCTSLINPILIRHICVVQEASVAFMAKALASQWRRSLVFHLHTVTQPNSDLDLHQHADALILQVRCILSAKQILFVNALEQDMVCIHAYRI